jgi:quinoprotein glucose dehydrogenase
MKRILPSFLLLLLLSCNHQPPPGDEHSVDWSVYGGGKDSRHYSPLTQIDTNNVAQLKVAWVYHTHDDEGKSTQIQANGLESNGIFYGVSPKLKLFALNARTGDPLWVFDPSADKENFDLSVCRGLSIYTDKDGAKRLFYAAASHLYCIEAATGKPMKDFGDQGSVDLHEGLDRNVQQLYVACTSPGIIYKDLLIIGTRVSETTPAAPGSIRAYDVHTGKRRWIFHTIPWPDEPGNETWDDTSAWQYAGGANAWSGFSLDEDRGIVFAPLGSASYDFYGGNRKGANLYANCVLALDAATGKRIWHYQTVHHDLWDKDLPAPPVLVSLLKDGKRIDALAQVSKSGFVFLLDRTTGEPVYPIPEIAVSTKDALPGDSLSPTQPEPSFPEPYVRQHLGPKDLNHMVSDESYQDLVQRLKSYRNGLFSPPSLQGTIVFPGFDGGSEWGGPAYDSASDLLIVNANEMAWILTMLKLPAPAPHLQQTNLQAGKALYQANCMGCHGPDRNGSGNNPSLIDVSKKYTQSTFKALLEGGRRMMPAFHQLGAPNEEALASYILNDKPLQLKPYISPQDSVSPFDQMIYNSTGYNKFLTKEGLPGIMPPWGTLSAISLKTGKVVWKDTLGDYPGFKEKGIHTGTENYGGPVVTAGGLVFIAATKDAKFRAFNKRTGQLLWETDLPACGFATPTVYRYQDKEYVVIACGGGKLNTDSGDSYLAFALP